MTIPKWQSAVLGLVFASRVYASACAPGTLQSYISLGSGGCTINGETVDNFNFSAIVGPLTALTINVTPSFGAGFYQLYFWSGGFSVSLSATAQYEIDFTWDPVVVGAGDQMDARSPTFPGTATVTTSLCAGSAFGGATCPSPTFTPTNTLTVFNDGVNADAITNAVTSFAQVSVVGTKSLITLDANGQTSEITGFYTSVFTPEPSAFGLAATGLLALALLRSPRRSG